jgi:hypothetical protein
MLWPSFKIILVGDFNQMSTTEIESHCCISPIITVPTRGQNILDQIFINTNDEKVYDIVTSAPISDSDHNCIFLAETCSENESKIKTEHKVYDFRQSNIDGFVTKMENYNFTMLFKTEDINEKVNILQNACNNALKSIPFRKVFLNSCDKPWMTPKLKIMINDRWQAYRNRDFGKYTHYKNKIKSEIINAKKSWINKEKDQSKHLWKVVHNMTGKSNVTSTVSSLKTTLDCNNDYELANIINNKFKQAFTQSGIPNDCLTFDKNDTIVIKEEEVFSELSQLRTKKAYPKSDLHPRLYLEASVIFTPILCNIFNHSMTTVTVPISWKQTEVIAIPKATTPSINDLRPISLLHTPIKIMEKILLKKLKNDFISNIDKNQYGFKPKSSTTCALLDIQDYITSQLEKSSTIAIAVLTIDFSKAFDRIDHTILIEKLRKLKSSENKTINTNFIKWLQVYLKDRKQIVRVNSSCSEAINITSGVPQGSSLSPYLFSLFVTDLQSKISHVVKFADDTTLLFTLTKENINEDLKVVESEIRNIQTWATNNNSVINNEKSKLLYILKHSPSKDILPKEILGFKVYDSLKLLGVTWTQNLSFNTHVDMLIKRASQRLHLLRILKSLLPKAELWNIYFALIRSLVEYACQLFITLPKNLSKNLERIQLRAHRIICGYNPCDCKVVTLEERRRILALRLFKNSMDMNHPLNGFLPPLTKHRRRIVPINTTNRRRNSFFVKCTILQKNIIVED